MSNLVKGVALLFVLLLPARTAHAQLDSSCIVSALNRATRVQADGTWVLTNVPSTQGLTRVRATCVADGVTRVGQSGLIAIPPNGVIAVAGIDFDVLQPIPEKLTLQTPATTLSTVGATAQLQAVAKYPDGTLRDVTAGDSGTNYRTSNAAIATVSAEGLVTARASGTVILSALNEGTLAVLRLQVVTSGDADGDGLPDDWEISHGLDPNNPIDALEDPDGDGLTNLEEYQLGTDPHAADTDGDGLRDGDEVHLHRTNPLLYDTDGDGIGDGLEVRTGSDPLDPASFDLAAAVQSIQAAPASFRIISNTALGGGSKQLRITGRLIDGHALDLTSRRYGTSYASSDLLIANFGPEDGRIYGGNDGTATITVSAGGHGATAAVTVERFSPRGISSLPMPGFANSVAVVGAYAYVAAGAAGLVVVDVSDLNRPFIAGSRYTRGNANDVRVVGSLAFVADGRRGLTVLDVGSPAHPQILGYAETPGVATDLAVAGNFVYVADEIGLRVFDAGNPAAPRLVGGVDLPGGRASGVDVSGSLAVVADSEGGVVVVDVSTPSSPRIAGRTATRPDGGSGAVDLVVRDRLAYVADGAYGQLGGLRVVDFGDPATPVVAGSSSDAFGLTSVAVEKGVALASDFYFINAVPIFQLNAGAPAFAEALDFWASGQGQANGNGLDVLDGVVFMVGTSTYGPGYQDNGSSGDSKLFIGRYALYLDDAGVPPTVTVTAPAAGGSLAGRSLVLLAADARDDVQVDSVDFLVDGQPVARVFRPPYEVKYVVPAGGAPLSITAIARDTGGNATTSEPVTLTVTPNPAPVAQLLAPVKGQNAVIDSQLALAASATGVRGVTRVDFLVNGARVASVAAAPYRATYRVPPGISQLTVSAVAYDELGASAPDGVTLAVVPDQPPVAAFLAPRDGDRVVEGSTVRILGGVSDDVGISYALFFADGALPVSRTGPPWVWSIPAPASGTARHLELQVLDTAGHLTRSEITITGAADPLTGIHGTVLDPDGQPVAGAQVTEDGSGEGATSGADGQFLIERVPTAAGTLSVTVSASLSGVPYTAQSPQFTPVPGGQAEIGQIVLAPDQDATTVTGLVLDSANHPVSAVRVAVIAPGPTVVKGTSGAGGRFRVPGVPQFGSVDVVAYEVQGRFNLQGRTPGSVPVVAGGITDAGTLVLAPTELPTTIQGTVVDTSSRPVAGAVVKIYGIEAFVSVTSAADGSFSVAGLPGGTSESTVLYTVTARGTAAGDLYRGSTVVQAVPDGVADAGQVVVELVAPGGSEPTTVQGQIATLSGQPVVAADLVVITEMDAYPATALGGQFTVAGIPSDEGVIQVVATAVVDGQYLAAPTPGFYVPAPGDTTAVDTILFDDTLGASGSGQRSRAGKLRPRAQLLPFAPPVCPAGPPRENGIEGR